MEPRLQRVGIVVAAATLLAASALARAQGPPAAPAQTASTPTAGGTIRGIVKAGTVPLPGVAITATNTLTGKKYATATDLNGAYSMTIPKTGRYVLRAELAAFAPASSEVRLTADAANQTAAFALELASRAAQAEAATERTQTSNLAAALGRGTQALAMAGAAEGLTDASTGGGSANPSVPSLGGLADSAASGNDSVAVSGAAGQTNGLASLTQDEIQSRIAGALANARAQGGATADQANAVAGILGGLMAGGGRGGPGGPGGGAFRNFNPAQPHGSVFYEGSYGALNALPFSLAGQPEPRQGNQQNRFGVTFIGSPSIPHLFKADTRQLVFFNLTGQRNITPQNFYATVPTLAERGGDFTGLTQIVSGQPVPIALYDPATLQPLTCNGVANVLCANRIPTQANALLHFYPAPNIPVAGNNAYNYQTITTAGFNSTQVSLRYIRNFGQQPSFGQARRQQEGPKTLSQNINFNGSYTGSARDNRNPFLALGGATANAGYGAVAGYTVGYGRLRNNASVNWNRSRANTYNYFTDGASNPATNSQVPVGNPTIYQNPFYFGVPSLQFSGFTGLSNQTPSDNIAQTISVSDSLGYGHKKHNMRFGFDIRRVHNDVIGGTNVLGQLTFSGCATAAPVANPSTGQPESLCQAPSIGSSTSTATGSGFADFLLGLPQQATVQASDNKLYLRENVFDWYAQDDWRASPGLTLNFGLRYEYFGPYTEKYNRLTNIDHNADFSQVAIVTPGQVGPISGIHFSRSLVNPDYTLYSPRFGFAWKPKWVKELVVRGGYGLNFNTTQYSRFATSLSDEPPFAVTQTNIAYSENCGQLTLAAAYGCSNAVQSNFGIDPNYRVGHVQVYNLDLQKTLGLGIVLNLGYNGSKGGNLDVVTAPNRTPSGLLNPTISAFKYENSLAFSRQNNLAVNARKRLQKGVSLEATYTYSHSIDDASSVNGAGNSVAQNPANLLAEESNSSFDIRHNLSGNFLYELPVGPNRAFLADGGKVSKLLDGFNVSGNFTFASGGYFTPQYTAAAAEVATGTNTSLRPDRVAAQPIAGPKIFSEWFNPNAFAAPSANNYGTASRYSIEGPGTVAFNASLSRTVSFAENRSVEARMTASNVFNTVQYAGIDTTENSPTFGRVTSTAAMRSINFIARYRF